MVIGCGTNAKLMDLGKIWAACASICGNNIESTDPAGCYGIDCCQSSIPTKETYYLSTYNVSFTPEDDEGNTTSSSYSTPVYAFLVDSDWLSRNFTSPEDITADDQKRAPLSLFWILKQGENASYLCNSTADYNSYRESYLHDYCSCPLPYEGNPYLPGNGCNHGTYALLSGSVNPCLQCLTDFNIIYIYVGVPVVKECASCLKTCEYDYDNMYNNRSYDYDSPGYACPKKDLKDNFRALILGNIS